MRRRAREYAAITSLMLIRQMPLITLRLLVMRYAAYFHAAACFAL